MALFNNFPYTNTHELNLDWIIEKMKELIDEWNAYGTAVSADAVAGTEPAVSVEGDLKNGLDFHFTLVRGEQGPQGLTGNGIQSVSMNSNYQLTLTFTDGTTWTSQSLQGPQGEGLKILDIYPTLADLQSSHPTGSAGDSYLVGTSPNFTLYVWSTVSSAWLDGGALTSPSPTGTTPLMDGSASIGVETSFARGDHRHPSDTSKQDVLQSGINIKTVNSESLLGSGDISVQEPLVSGTNIKSINNESILGSGDITVGAHGIDLGNILASGNAYQTAGILSYTATEDCFLIMKYLSASDNTLTIDGDTIDTLIRSTNVYLPISKGSIVEQSKTSQNCYWRIYGLK